MKHIAKQPASLLDILQEMAPDSSKNTLRSWLQQGRVMLDQKPTIQANTEVKTGQLIEVGPRVFFTRSLKILYHDDEIVVLVKPEGLLSVSTDFETRATVHAMLKKQFHSRRVFPVHRLDRETSGVMLFAYSESAQEDLKKQFEKHEIEKQYIALVEGKMPSQEEGTWESYLEEDDFYYVKTTNNSTKGKLASTHYKVLKSRRNSTLLCLQPKTGRKNQLRVHCSEAGYPIVGDKKYGAKTNPLKRMCLHAESIRFTHPKDKRRLCFKEPAAAIFQE